VIARAWRRLRLSERVLVLWGALLLAVAALAGAPLSLGANLAVTHSLVSLVILAMLFHLLRLLLILSRKTAAGLAVVAGRAGASELERAVRFGEERAAILGMLAFARDVAPVVLAVLLYPQTELLNTTLQGDRVLDARLAEIDVWLFGGHPSVWLDQLVSPALTQVMSFCYAFHMPMPMIVLGFIYLWRERALFVEAIDGFVCMMTLGLLGYILVPGVGPRYLLAPLYTHALDSGALTQMSEAVVSVLRVPRDIFPSLHAAASALVLLYAFRASRALGLALLLPTLGNWISTLYLRYHYGIDLVAGFLLVPIVYQGVRRERAAAQPAAGSAGEP